MNHRRPASLARAGLITRSVRVPNKVSVIYVLSNQAYLGMGDRHAASRIMTDVVKLGFGRLNPNLYLGYVTSQVTGFKRA